jgi:ABC-2 type transport system permease protein
MALGKRELIAYFLSPVGYVVGFAFVGLYNLFFYFGFTSTNDANVALGGGISGVMFLVTFAIPFLTMGLLADEKRTGTIEMLMTAPVADWEVVVGKYLGALVFVLFLSVPSLLHIIVVQMYGRPEWGPVISGYVGFALVLLLLTSMGLFFSTVSRSSLVSVMISFVIFMTLLILGIVVPEAAPAIETQKLFGNAMHYLFAFLRYASLGEHYNNFTLGLVNTKDVIYFVSGTVFFLFLSTLAVESRKWK